MEPNDHADPSLSILAVTSEIPWPLNTGGHLRTFHILRSLARRHRIRLIVPVRDGEGIGVEALSRNGIGIIPVTVGPRDRLREGVRALKALSKYEPYVLYRRHDHPALRSILRAEVRREPADILYLDHLDSLLYRRVVPNTPAIVDLHNVYSILTQRAAMERSSPLARLYLRHEAVLLDLMERKAIRQAEALILVSEEDQSHFTTLGARACHVVPNGVDCLAYESLPVGRRSVEPLILYVGSLSWGPNVAAARFLSMNLLPRIRTRFPEARLRIVGKAPTPEVLALGRLPGVEVLGSVPDIVPYLRDAALLAVPLEAGGGTRLKILEAFAAGLPVVSTPIGCEGIDAVPGEHLLVADRDQFDEPVLSLLSNRTLGEQVAARARLLVRDQFDWGVVGETACKVVESVSASDR